MGWTGSRIEGGVVVHTDDDGIAAGTHTLVTAAQNPRGASHGWTVDLFVYTKGAATSIKLEDTNGDPITPTINSNIALEHGALGTRNGVGIVAVVSGSGGEFVLRLVPEKNHDVFIQNTD